MEYPIVRILCPFGGVPGDFPRRVARKREAPTGLVQLLLFLSRGGKKSFDHAP